MSSSNAIPAETWDFSNIPDAELYAAYVHEYASERPLRGKRPSEAEMATFYEGLFRHHNRTAPVPIGKFYQAWWFAREFDSPLDAAPWAALTSRQRRFSRLLLFDCFDGEMPETDARGEPFTWTQAVEVASADHCKRAAEKHCGNDPDDPIEIAPESDGHAFVAVDVNLKHFTPRQIAKEFERLLSSLPCERVKKRGPGATRYRAALDNLAIVRIRHRLPLGDAMDIYENSHLRKKFCDDSETLDRYVIDQRIREARREVGKHFERVNSDIADTVHPVSMAERGL